MSETASIKRGVGEKIAICLAALSLTGAAAKGLTAALERADSYRVDDPEIAQQERRDSAEDFKWAGGFLVGFIVFGGIAFGHRSARVAQQVHPRNQQTSN